MAKIGIDIKTGTLLKNDNGNTDNLGENQTSANAVLASLQTQAEALLKKAESVLAEKSDKLKRLELIATAEAMQALQLASTMHDENLLKTRIEIMQEVLTPIEARS